MKAVFVFLVLLILAATAVQHKRMSDADDPEAGADLLPYTREDCHVPPGQLLFLHVMKNGGTSVDAFLACHCKRVGCSMRLSLGAYGDTHGIQECEQPSVCSTHGKYTDRRELCGDAFETPAKVFTVLRDPVDRVFSLYNYEKAHGMDLPSIADVYAKCDSADGPTAANAWLCFAMINHMTLQTFSMHSSSYTSEVNTTLLEEAKATTSGLDAVFFMEDFGNFVSAFNSSLIITHEYFRPRAKQCELGHSNPTTCENCAAEATPEEKELIRMHNQMDIMLYDYASTLPNRFRGTAAQATGELGAAVQEEPPELEPLRQTLDEIRGFE